MPKVSKQDVSQVRDFGTAVDRTEDFGDYQVSFVAIQEDSDLTPLLSGLPDGLCPCPHWGYLFKGQITVRYADHEETISGGDAYYMSPGHVPAAAAGSEFVQFSPAAEIHKVEAAMAERMRQLQGA